jgi:hypothetical protein
MHFHVVLFGNQHEIWSKQHNGKVSLQFLSSRFLKFAGADVVSDRQPV